jgi:hypothetical protein
MAQSDSNLSRQKSLQNRQNKLGKFDVFLGVSSDGRVVASLVDSVASCIVKLYESKVDNWNKGVVETFSPSVS